MKVCVLIMSTPVEPSLRNMDAMAASFVSDAARLAEAGRLKHDYDFVIYQGVVSDDDIVHASEISSAVSQKEKVRVGGMCMVERTYNIQESVYTTYEKTYCAFMDIAGLYAYVVRINISTFINMELLDRMIDNLDPDCVYCNALNTYVTYGSTYMNDVYPRGDFYIMSNRTLVGVLKHGRKFFNCDMLKSGRIDVPHVDDCLVGLAMISYFNKIDPDGVYCDHMRMLRYNFLPEVTTEDIKSVDGLAIASRVKTVPPTETYSGYSWADNDYRKVDCDKMVFMSLCLRKVEPNTYDDIVLDDLILKGESSRPFLCVGAESIKMNDNYVEALKRKWNRIG